MTTILKASPAFQRRGVHKAITGMLVCAAAALWIPAMAQAASEANAPKQNTVNSSGALGAKTNVTPPDPATVMYFTYDIDGKGATTYEVTNGSVATYWYGHAFEHGGKQYYTGFSWDTADRYGKPGEDNVGPDTQANIAEVTFILANESAEKPWKFRGMEHTIGMFGAYEKGPEVDTNRKAIEYRAPSGKLVLAVPTITFATGSSIEGYELLMFNPTRLEVESNDNVWNYVGNIITGEDNAAACDSGTVMPCIGNSGELTFTQGKDDMPQATVKMSGTTFAGPDKTRKFGPADTQTYVYDSKSKAYVSR